MRRPGNGSNMQCNNNDIVNAAMLVAMQCRKNAMRRMRDNNNNN